MYLGKEIIIAIWLSLRLEKKELTHLITVLKRMKKRKNLP